MTKELSIQSPSSPMSQLLDNAEQPSLPKVGDIVDGIVVSVSKNEAYLDINGLMMGVIRGNELFDESGNTSSLKVGDTAQATVLELENEKGILELSFRQAGHQKAWGDLAVLMNSENIMEVPVTDANKGGIMVRIGRVEGFLPVSQLTVEHYPRVEGGDKNKILEMLSQLIGKNLKVKIIDINEEDNKLIVSEKAAWEEEQKDVLAKYHVGDSIDGVVTGVVDFGAFVEFGDKLEGLVHISELAWQRIDNPRDIIAVGDRVQAKIIGIDGSKISLSLKALINDPWKEAVKRYSIGQLVTGKVLKINPFGLFVELDQDIHGLAHISELSESHIHSPSEIAKVGESREFKIISIEPEHHRLGLSIKALTASSEKEPSEKMPADDKKQEDEKPEISDEKK
ncbi:MAG: S1 RNA-binding domain-containing protein [Patescibacteria group bacterium]|jgi:ribosomal protein S1